MPFKAARRQRLVLIRTPLANHWLVIVRNSVLLIVMRALPSTASASLPVRSYAQIDRQHDVGADDR
jgi:hypothetical protein